MIFDARLRPSIRATLLIAATLLGGCAAYRPLPLGGGEGAAGATRLSVPASAMPLPELAVHRFDPADGLDATEVAMLAVANSPELKVQREIAEKREELLARESQLREIEARMAREASQSQVSEAANGDA